MSDGDSTDNAQFLEQEWHDAHVRHRVQFHGHSALRCEVCDALIPQGRREAVPGTQRCVECAE